MICQVCKTENEEGRTTCINCGFPLNKTIKNEEPFVEEQKVKEKITISPLKPISNSEIVPVNIEMSEQEETLNKPKNIRNKQIPLPVALIIIILLLLSIIGIQLLVLGCN